MEPKRDLAIVLRSIAYQERHRIVTALSENHGLVSALARNSIQSRRFGGALEPFAASEWYYTERNDADLLSLQQAQIRRPYEGLRKSFERLSLASVFNELLLKLAPQRQACPELFKLHTNALALLEETPENVAIEIPMLNTYLAKLLQWSGNQPQLQACMGCETRLEAVDPSEPLSCIIADAGWICSNCRVGGTKHLSGNLSHTMLRVSPLAVLDFHISLSFPIRQVMTLLRASPDEHRGLFQLLEALFVYHIPSFDKQPLKSLRFLGLESNLQQPTTNPR